MPIDPNEQTQVQFIVSKGNRRFLKQYAGDNGTSISAVVREALQEYFDQRGVKVDMSEAVGEWGKSSERVEGEE
jgi:protein involved in ribonucleotide reduction